MGIVFGHPVGVIERIGMSAVHGRQHPVAVGGIQPPSIQNVVEDVIIKDLPVRKGSEHAWPKRDSVKLCQHREHTA